MILASTSYAPLGSDFEVWTKNDKHTPKPAKGNKFIIALEELAEDAHIMPGFIINSTQRTIIFDQAFLQEEVNPLTGNKEPLSNEDMITLALIHKAKKGDVNAYKALMDSAYGGVKQSLELTDAETPIFKQLDIDVIE